MLYVSLKIFISIKNRPDFLTCKMTQWKNLRKWIGLSQLAVAWPSLAVPFPVTSVIMLMGKQLGV